MPSVMVSKPDAGFRAFIRSPTSHACETILGPGSETGVSEEQWDTALEPLTLEKNV